MLGEGHYGVVRKAVKKSTGARVALKAVCKDKLSEIELEMAKKEIDILKCCQHPNIVRFIDVFENQQYIYIIMELVTGPSLYDYLDKRDFRIPEKRAYNIIASLASALNYLNNFGIVHRDLKLENIMMEDLSEDSDVKLLDFGLSRMLGPNQKCAEAYGTIGYVAPEILLQNDYDKTVDIWSLGVVSYILLSGIDPFHADTQDEIAK